jgi:Dullard-like phosphatase family protein
MSLPRELYNIPSNISKKLSKAQQKVSSKNRGEGKKGKVNMVGRVELGATPVLNHALRNSETNNYNFVTNNYIINSKNTEDYSIYSEIKPIVSVPKDPKSKPRKKRNGKGEPQKLIKARKSNRNPDKLENLNLLKQKEDLGKVLAKEQRRRDYENNMAKQGESGRMSWKDQIRKLDEEDDYDLLSGVEYHFTEHVKGGDKLREKRGKMLKKGSERLIKSFRHKEQEREGGHKLVDLYNSRVKRVGKGVEDLRMFKTEDTFYSQEQQTPDTRKRIDFMDIYNKNKKKIKRKNQGIERPQVMNKTQKSLRKKKMRKMEGKYSDLDFESEHNLNSHLNPRKQKRSSFLKNYNSQQRLKVDRTLSNESDFKTDQLKRQKYSLLSIKNKSLPDTGIGSGKPYPNVYKSSQKEVYDLNMYNKNKHIVYSKNAISLSNLTKPKGQIYRMHKKRYNQLVEPNIYDCSLQKKKVPTEKIPSSSLSKKSLLTRKLKSEEETLERVKLNKQKGERLESLSKYEGVERKKKRDVDKKRSVLMRVKSNKSRAMDLGYLNQSSKKSNKRGVKGKHKKRRLPKKQHSSSSSNSQQDNDLSEENFEKMAKIEFNIITNRGKYDSVPQVKKHKLKTKKSIKRTNKKLKKFELNYLKNGKYNLTQGTIDSSEEAQGPSVTFYNLKPKEKPKRKKRNRNLFIDAFAEQMGMKESEKMFLKSRLDKPSKKKVERKQIYNQDKIQKKMNERLLKRDALEELNNTKGNLMNVSSGKTSKMKDKLTKINPKVGVNSFSGPSGNKIGALISEVKPNNTKYKHKNQNIIGSIEFSELKQEPVRVNNKIANIEYTNFLNESKSTKKTEIFAMKKNPKKIKKSKKRKIVKNSISKSKLKKNNSKSTREPINASRATIFHYEFNINTFNNFMNSLKMMGFKEFDIEEYSQGASTTSIKNYMDSPFPSKALQRQNSLVNLTKDPSTKQQRDQGLYNSFQTRPHANSLNTLRNVPRNQLSSMHRSMSQKSKDFVAFKANTKQQSNSQISLKEKLKRNMSSNQLPTTLEPIPEQELYPAKTDIPLQLRKVSLMNKNTEGLSKGWFSSLQTYNIQKYKDPKINKYLVLDLDETLIHCSTKMLNKDAKQVSLFGRTIYIHLRPYVRAFLREMRKHFNLVIYTASKKAYADIVLQFLDPENQLFCLRLYRTSCQRVVSNHVIKTMGVMNGLDPKKTLIIDNSLICFYFDLENVVPILSYFGSVKDQELYLLCTFIVKELIEKKVPDFRTKLKEIFKLEMLKTGMDKNLILKSILSK